MLKTQLYIAYFLNNKKFEIKSISDHIHLYSNLLLKEN